VERVAEHVTRHGRVLDSDNLLVVKSDDSELIGDGREATRVVLAVTDAFGNFRPFVTGAIELGVAGLGEIVGENPFSLSAARGRAKPEYV
jgi:beta-galactosidase